MRADEYAVVALDTGCRVPNRHIHCNSALLVCGCAVRHSTVHIRNEGAYRQGVSALCVHNIGDVLYERSCETVCVRVGELGADVCPLGRNFNLGVFATAVDGGIVHIHHILALLAVALQGSVLHILHCVLGRNDAGDAEEC